MKTQLTPLIFLLSLSGLLAQELQLIVPLGHSRRVSDMEVSADGQWMASVDGSDHIKIWDYSSGEELYQLKGHDGQVNLVEFHPESPNLASAGNDRTIRIWEVTGSNLLTISPAQPIQEIRFHRSGDTLIALGNTNITLWNTRDGTQIGELETKLKETTSLEINGDLAYIGSQSGEIAVVDLRSGKHQKTYQVADNRIGSIAVGPSGNLFIATDAGELIAFNLENAVIDRQKAFAIRNYKILIHDQLIYAVGRDTKNNLKVFNATDLSPANSPIQLSVDHSSETFAFGLRALAFGSDTTLLIADYQQVIREWGLKNNQWVQRSFRGLAAPVYDLAVNFNERQLAIASGHEYVKVIDLTGATGDLVLPGYPGGTRSVDFHPVNPMIATYGIDESILVKDIISQAEVFKLRAKGKYTTTPVAFDPTGRYILRKSSNEEFDFYDFKTKSPKTIKVKDGTEFHFSPDGRKLFFKLKDGIALYDPVTIKETGFIPIPKIQDFSFRKDGSFTVLLQDDQTLWFYNKNQEKVKEAILPAAGSSDRVRWTGDVLIGYRNSIPRGAQPDFSLKVIDEDGKMTKQLPGHSGFTSSLQSVKGRYLFTSATDGQIKIWDLKGKEAYKASLIPLDQKEYVVTTAIGLFDATPGAMKKLHYVKAGKIIALDQLKSTYYEPNLLSKILGYNQEPLKTVAAISSLSLYPELNIEHPLQNDGRLGINLSDNGGGIGRIVILINGKEVSSDVRAANTLEDQSNMEIDYAIEGHPFLYNDRVNKVTIKAYNKDGTISSGEKSVYLFGEEKVVEQPKLFAVIAGTSDYEGEALDLKYAAKDASDFAKAIRLSAYKYLGAQNVSIELLTTDQDTAAWPTKENIAAAFRKFSREATAKDILLVYLSGHGVNHSGANSDFYYLTCAASSGDMNNTALRDGAAISSTEFTEYIKAVPALKQILVIDACHSGRFASSLASSRSAMSSTQIRALERMKDRTGMFVLAGSAADAVSYETTLFGQGLLTYSLLFGMKGAALRDDEFIDVLQLFQFAANKVPELAEEIGGVQKPEIRLPEDGRSFDIGRLEYTDRELIQLKAPKPVFVHSRFQDESAIYDHLKISDLLDQKLLELSKANDPRLVFVDDKNFSGAMIIHGRYQEADGLIKGVVTVEKGGQEINKMEIEAVNADVFTLMITEKTLELVTDK